VWWAGPAGHKQVGTKEKHGIKKIQVLAEESNVARARAKGSGPWRVNISGCQAALFGGNFARGRPCENNSRIKRLPWKLATRNRGVFI